MQYDHDKIRGTSLEKTKTGSAGFPFSNKYIMHFHLILATPFCGILICSFNKSPGDVKSPPVDAK